MRQEPNNEIDLLLRRLSRQEDAPIPDADVHIDEQHLDADELSSYAANALPDAARMRYTEHLAECSSCRKLVAQLSLSLGAVATEQISKASGPSGLKKFLASIFSPMVLRYAVPALGLIVVMAVGLMVLRKEGSADYVAEVRQKEQSKRAAAEPAQAQTPASGLVGYDSKAGEPAPTPQTRTTKTGEVKPETKASGDAAVAAPAPQFRDAKQDAPATATEQQPFAAQAAPPAKLAASDVEAQRKAELEKRGPPLVGEQAESTSDVSKARAKEPAKEEDRSADEVAASRIGPAENKPQPQGMKSGRISGGAESREGVARARGARSDKDATEIRSIAGRRFRKDGGVWIDTAYDSSRGAMNLTRGSEQYRVLIADEPAIRTIAEQLDGEIIVVWKGRAYRIR